MESGGRGGVRGTGGSHGSGGGRGKSQGSGYLCDHPSDIAHVGRYDDAVSLLGESLWVGIGGELGGGAGGGGRGAFTLKAPTYCSASRRLADAVPSLWRSAAATVRVAAAEAFACISSATASPLPRFARSCISASDASTRASFLPVAMFT